MRSGASRRPGPARGRGLVLTALGLAPGRPAFAGLARVLRGLLFGVAPGDPTTLATVSGLVAAAALVGAGLPAARAARVDPASELRGE